MFVEPQFRAQQPYQKPHMGWVEVICGSMFSGKTEELIRRLRRATLARQHVEIFKPKMDTRYHLDNVVSHNNNMIRSTPVSSAKEIVLLATDCDIVGIDEAQFFNDDLIEVCDWLAGMGKRVIIAGLDMDFAGKPFGPMPALMATAEFVTKVHAVCMRCGGVASHSYRLNSNQETLLLGETDVYEARCRTCFREGMEKMDAEPAEDQ